MTTTFYAPPSAFSGDRVALPDDEARHAVKVLRMTTGDALTVVDGVGGWHECELTEMGKSAHARVVTTKRDVNERRVGLWLAMSPLSKRDRLEFAVEKAVELGVTDIVLIQTARMPPGRIRVDRLESRLVAAMKQSLRCRLPTIHECEISDLPTVFPDVQWIVLHEGAEVSLAGLLADSESGRAVGLVIGPEGGFTDAEVSRLSKEGARVALLGSRRLRAETAAVAACSLAMALHSQT